MADIYSGLLLTSWVAKAAAKSKSYKIHADGTVVFRMHISVGIYGFLGIIAMAACAFIPDTAAMLMMMAIIGLLSIPVFLYYLCARLYINDKKIEYRNPLGLRREIVWEELTAAIKIGITGDIVLCGGGKKIRLYPYYSGFLYVLQLLHQLKPEAFDPEYVLANTEEFTTKDGCLMFAGRKQFCTMAIIMILLGFSFLLLPDSMFVPENGSRFLAKLLIAAIFVVCGLPFLLPANTRLYLDDEKIIHRNMLFIKKTILWEDIESYRISEKGLFKYISIHYGYNKKISVGGEFFGYDVMKYIICKTGMERRVKSW